ncbi:MAG: Maf family protein [Roseiflexus sp.]|nr:Maf family protein [Roseiflexus sp.]MCS7289234.1 Maf family protein [Roseiflexus sp.]MDW8146704.1 Maf family protein [Roseiflexaceae bacterium]MDW8232647.1 Maf family protein [Roseiflexaceae bacterium]
MSTDTDNPPSPPLALASASPRRRELLAYLGVPFRVIATDAEEHAHPPPPEIVAALPPLALPLFDHPTLRAWRKASAACASAPDSVIIGADTIVTLEGEVLNKPIDPDDARRMLRRLSGKTHTVYTGLAVIDARQTGAPPLFDLVASRVTVAVLSDADIDAYVATGEPLDKAGAYGIQGLGGRLVRAVAGSFTCVVGLPLVETWRLLRAAGIRGLGDPVEGYRRWLLDQGKEIPPCPPTLP